MLQAQSINDIYIELNKNFVYILISTFVPHCQCTYSKWSLL